MSQHEHAQEAERAMSAIISECGRYRYRLEREVLDAPGMTTSAIIMVNPSTADAIEDDATIRKLKGFGLRNGWHRIIVGNLFAYRSTDVRELAKVDDPIGPENDLHLRVMLRAAHEVIFAWGPTNKLPQRLRERWQVVHQMALDRGKRPKSIGAPAKDGHPCHPLMLAYDRPLLDWSRPA